MSDAESSPAAPAAGPEAAAPVRPRSSGLGGAAKEVGFFTLSKFNQHGPVGTIAPLLLTGFIVVSALAMYKGIDDLLKVARPDLHEASLVRAFIFGIVFLVAGSMWATLELALRSQKIRHRIIAFSFYIFLTLWSLGFGYGFWWSLLAGREATTNRLVAMREALEAPITRIQTDADTLRNSVNSIATESERRQTQEAQYGGSCDNARMSPLGDGPLAKERFAITESVKQVTQRVETEWVAKVNEQANALIALQSDVAAFDQGSGASPNDRDLSKESFDEISQKASDIGNRLSSLHASVVPNLQGELTSLASRMQEGSVCVDLRLAERLTTLSNDLNAPPQDTTVPRLEFVDGAYATAYAFDRLWETVFEYAGAATEGLTLPGETTLKVAGAQPVTAKAAAASADASRNDIIALVAAIVVELGIFVFTVISPRRPFEQADFARRARAPVQQRLLSAFKNFSADNKVEARRAIDDLLIHTGNRRAYLISPSFRSGVSQSGDFIRDRELEHRRQFIQNILIVLEEALAVDRTLRFGPIRKWVADTFPWLQTSRLFAEALERLEKHGWDVRDEGDFRLHRIRRGELLEVLMMLREELPTEAYDDREDNRRTRGSRRRDRRGGGFFDNLRQALAGRDSDDDYSDDADDDRDRDEFDDEDDEAPRPKRRSRREASRSRREDRVQPLDALREPTPKKKKKARASKPPQAEAPAPVAEASTAPALANGHDGDRAADPAETIPDHEIISEIDDLSNELSTLERMNDPQTAERQRNTAQKVSDMLNALYQRGLEATPVRGLANPYWHNIIDAVPSEEPLNTILAVHRHGFFGPDGKLMRQANVTVSNGQPPVQN